MKIDELARTWHQEATLPEKLRQRLLREAPEPPERRRARPNVRLVLAGGTLLTFGLTTMLWYRNHYTIPAEPVRTFAEPRPNGYLTALEACKLEVKQKDGIKTLTSSREPAQPLAGRKALLAANQKSIAKLREALGQEWLVPASTNPSQTASELAGMREEARMLSALAANTYAEQGNLPEAAQCATDTISMGVHLPRGAALLHGVSGIACEAIGDAALWKLIDRMDAKTARATVSRLRALEQQRWSYQDVMRAESRSHWRSTNQLFAGGLFKAWKELQGSAEASAAVMAIDRNYSGPTLSQRWEQVWFQTRALYYGPKTTIEAMDGWVEERIAQSEQPWQAHRVTPPLSDPLSRRFAEVLTRLEFLWRRNEAYRQLLITDIALHAYKLEKGHTAPSLVALVTDGYLPKLPHDPFSPTRASLGYARGNLWSVGPDAKDDGGFPPRGPGELSIQEEYQGDIIAQVNTLRDGSGAGR